MNKFVLVLALSLSALSAKAQVLDVTTCNPALLARLNQMTTLTKEERKAIEYVNTVFAYKTTALKDFAVQMKPLSEAALNEAGIANKTKDNVAGLAQSSTASGKLMAYTAMFKTLKADIDAMAPCYNRTTELLGKK